jgi:ribosomal protein S18 acetylase RimI-like enzyme
MTRAKLIERTPWDCAALGCDAFELKAATAEALALARAPGHYTVKVDPLAPKADLHSHGFYYCDTLIEPYCEQERFTPQPPSAARFDRRAALEPLLAIARGAFRHDRFHRDFNVARAAADVRYENWLRTLHSAGKLYGLLWEDEVTGFIGHEGGRLVLHAMAEKHRGRHIARHCWSIVCADLLQRGERELSSSISAANLAALNLYVSLGFRFRNPLDIYHRVIR